MSKPHCKTYTIYLQISVPNISLFVKKKHRQKSFPFVVNEKNRHAKFYG